MGRKYVDCREMPSEKNCSLYISGTEDEVVMAATQHAISAHGHEDTPELRDEIRKALKDEAAVPA
jgi:predicted small metal-binding protein